MSIDWLSRGLFAAAAFAGLATAQDANDRAEASKARRKKPQNANPNSAKYRHSKEGGRPGAPAIRGDAHVCQEAG